MWLVQGLSPNSIGSLPESWAPRLARGFRTEHHAFMATHAGQAANHTWLPRPATRRDLHSVKQHYEATRMWSMPRRCDIENLAPFDISSEHRKETPKILERS
jgi:hypothetical protein